MNTFESVSNHEGQILFPFEFEDIIYFVNLVEKGKRLDCRGVWRFQVIEDVGVLTPNIIYQDKMKAKTQRIIKAAKIYFKENKDK